MISAGTFNITSCTFNCLNICPLVVFAGDACQQQPLETINRQITPMASMLNDCSFTSDNSIKHTLYQQFHIFDMEWARFMDFRWYTQPNQEQLDQFLAISIKHTLSYQQFHIIDNRSLYQVSLTFYML